VSIEEFAVALYQKIKGCELSISNFVINLMTTRPLENPHRVAELLMSQAAQHATLLPPDKTALLKLRPRTRHLTAGEDIVRQGDRPDVAVIVLSGMLARYQTISSGDRQYISFHIAGDMPDIQSLFLSIMDHSVCAVSKSEIGIIPHDQLIPLVAARPSIAFAFWRSTLIDASIFRQAVTNNGARPHLPRVAHLFCEQHYRAKEAGLAEGRFCDFPLSQAEIGQALGMANISVNRALQKLRKQQLADLRSARLEIIDWSTLARLADFDPSYLHLTNDTELGAMAFKGRRG
jgi:CRP-like cAMP-binding protein